MQSYVQKCTIANGRSREVTESERLWTIVNTCLNSYEPEGRMFESCRAHHQFQLVSSSVEPSFATVPVQVRFVARLSARFGTHRRRPSKRVQKCQNLKLLHRLVRRCERRTTRDIGFRVWLC